MADRFGLRGRTGAWPERSAAFDDPFFARGRDGWFDDVTNWSDGPGHRSGSSDWMPSRSSGDLEPLPRMVRRVSGEEALFRGQLDYTVDDILYCVNVSRNNFRYIYIYYIYVYIYIYIYHN